jgi:flagellar protein FliS
MQNAQFAKSYRTVAVRTAPPGQLILMLFDGALRFMATAERGFSEDNIITRNETIHNNLVKTRNILIELQVSLDMQRGGEFATRMRALYGFMLTQLQQADLKKEIGPIQAVERLLGEIRNAWAQMLKLSVPANRAA